MTLSGIHPSRLVIATHNNGKLLEFRGLLRGLADNVVSAGELGLPEPEETGTTFIDNALLKARAAAAASGSLALADDSGICVNALGGAPGLFSGRYAEKDGKRDFPWAMQRLHNEIGANADRSAYFICVLALAWPDGRNEVFEGRLNGTIIWPPRGTNGHGYDPCFQPEHETRTFAEMTEDEKGAISHRGRATQKLIHWWRAQS